MEWKVGLVTSSTRGEWLAGEMSAWKRNGIQTVCSLLTHEEARDLNMDHEEEAARSNGMDFLAFPIPDRQLPALPRDFAITLDRLDTELSAGRNVVLHCRQGVGRTGLLAACLLIASKLAVFEKLSSGAIKFSLAPGQVHCLKVRPDGTMLDGHHRVHVLKMRGENIDDLPRECRAAHHSR
jgi:protein tyrosine phosphatase (PTP) superfamily phosphohydrolase (DUF442 family)